MQEIRDTETLEHSLSRFFEKVLLVLSGKSQVSIESRKIGRALIFQRLLEELGVRKVLDHVLRKRLFWFDVERAMSLAVMHRHPGIT